MTDTGTIRTGIGGWNFEPWRGTFYPQKLPQSKELNYASERLATIEINATYYGSQKPATWAKWSQSVPDGFVFSLKGSRYVTNRKVLGEAGESIAKFLGQGIVELGDRLGPILWQFAPTKAFDPADFEAFLQLLPEKHEGLSLSHALEVRHPSFVSADFVALAERHSHAIVYAHHAEYPEIADVTSNFVYARLQRGSDDIDTCYGENELGAWADRCRAWSSGGQPDDLPRAAPDRPVAKQPRDVFVYFIHEGKVRAPQGAMALAARCG